MHDNLRASLIPSFGNPNTMHAGKIRTANIPAFQLSPRDTVILASLLGLTAYVLGFLVGLTA